MLRRIGLWRIRRALTLIFGAFMMVSVLLFLNVQVSEVQGGALELINGRQDTSALAVPLALFLIGAVGLLFTLSWRPGAD